MIGARARVLAGVAVLAATCALPRHAHAAGNAPGLSARPEPNLPETYPLVLVFQGDAVVDAAPSGSGPAAGDDPPRGGSELRFRRLRIGEDVGRGAWRARALLEASSRDAAFAPVEGGRLPTAGFVRVTEAFAAWRPHRAFALELGAQRVPFSLSRQVDEVDLRLPERAQALVALAPDYRTGFTLASDLGLLDLRVTGMSADRSVDDRLLTSGYFGALRLSADPIGPVGTAPWRRGADDPWYGWWRFSGGVSVLYGTLLAPRTLALGGDAQLQWRRVTVTGEYVGQHVGAGTAAPTSQGAVVEPGVFLASERLELVLRGSWYRQPPSMSGAAPGPTDTFAGGGGLTFYARDAHVRVQAGLELRRTLDARLPDSGWAIIRATLVL
ncbi:MAG TPA: hypothetical protein VGK52_14915 [Polyangia bacterium]|jgi:hypothetical protein